MSRTSYRHNVALGVTGRNTSTCLAAVFEILSPEGRLQPKTYRTYERYIGLERKLQGQARRLSNPMMKEMYRMVVDELEDRSFDDLDFRDVRSERDFLRQVTKSVLDDCRVILDLGEKGDKETHAVGILPSDTGIDRYRLTSTWVPYCLRGLVTLEQVYPFLAHSPDPH
ncbi:hypothetical protein HY218_01275 [Candidatus Saccharibacteria bacterium]|nr:hypothetical protein [Candidatus Saccharibacteria bacterium]